MSRRKKEGRRIRAEIGEELRNGRATLRSERAKGDFLWRVERIPLHLALLEAHNQASTLAKSDSRKGEEMAQAGVRECDQSEVAEVEEWRLGQLLDAGYDEGSAWILAKARNVDLHLAVELVTKRGCSPETAKKILL